ncbi:hypothetical protein G6L45_16060 [Agrobacterium rhizogenes]|nr:hypothetical protein [Rhizobium rhizogenes]NTH97000.1 hypothetical protein [Rhizobium rhizogenes]NTJ15186.1 hypothetical protein [Rhizobium rhizogenes]
MTWGDTYNRHKSTGMDPNDAAFRADQSDPTRKRRAEVENERLREVLIQADLKIRSFHGADQSDVEFIREALVGNHTPAPEIAALRAENERLRKALKPFASFASVADEGTLKAHGLSSEMYLVKDHDVVATGGRYGHSTYRTIKFGDFRVARAALSSQEGSE